MALRHQSLHRARVAAREALAEVPRLPMHPQQRVSSPEAVDLASSLTRRSPPGSGGGGSGGSGGSSSSGGSTSSPKSGGSSASASCKANDKSARCEKPADGTANTTLPIALGVVIPILIAIAIFIVLHRRHVKRLKIEEANDKHGSGDYGMQGAVKVKSKGKKQKQKPMPEMSLADEKEFRRNRGMSMDMGDMRSPYILPQGLQNSRESLHSLSRSMPSADDRYRTASTFGSNDSSAPRGYPPSPRRMPDNSSSYTSSSGGVHDAPDQELLKNASRMSKSSPPNQSAHLANRGPPVTKPPPPAFEMGRAGLPSGPKGLPPTPKGLPATPRSNLSPPVGSSEPRDSYIEKDGGDMRRSNNYLGALINPRDLAEGPDAQRSEAQQPRAPSSTYMQQTDNRKSPPPAIATAREPSPPPAPPPRQDSRAAPPVQMPMPDGYRDDGSVYDNYLDERNGASDATKPLPPPPSGPTDSLGYPAGDYQHDNNELLPMSFDTRRLSMGMRPLPPDDPSDDPEIRANRIRSFYKEYFDDSKPGPFPQEGAYYEDYGQEYLQDAPYFDPETGDFVMAGAPHAEPVHRRAMTPPPRAPPRFRGPPRSHGSSMSGMMPPGPRAYSSASGRMGPPGPRGRPPPGPRKQLPPPSPLRVLPTPHLLKEDSFALPIDFAPPTSYKDRQVGRPESPRGGSRPYSPMVPAHLPLASSFDDLSVMPSPHALRKSGTFTGLDFAPPPRFKNSESGASDTGSIRSNRSAMSATQLHSIRTGAYRVSRIPKGVVGTRNDFASELRPTWDMKR
ncbi:MAG: hypothetical protein M1832_003984 [Thelocarpon impressellum]|nr:MAG: hypothetical protein M1832_003984 [Thelocarpon impressellum]